MIASVNPVTNEVIKKMTADSAESIESKLEKAHVAQQKWSHLSYSKRAVLMNALARRLTDSSQDLARLAALEMGKPLAAGIAEVEKCAWVCEFYAQKTGEMLAPAQVKTDARDSYVRFDPLGVILAVMPWNFPFWQVIRFAAPALMAGNVCMLKHASNVPQCAGAIEDIILKAGFPEGVFQTLYVESAGVHPLIADSRVSAVTLTGSEQAGRKVAESAGKAIKKTVLELGGSDPFIVLSDADVKMAASVAATARLQNAGQSCIAAKRFIVDGRILDRFVDLLENEFLSIKVGDPLDPSTQMGPLATAQILSDTERQVKDSVKKGAHVICGGERIGKKSNFYAPTILREVVKGMPAYSEEIFGPVASVIAFDKDEEALTIANDTNFGLGASVWTQDRSRAEPFIKGLQTGAVFVNSMVKSDPRLPFGGVKNSGYGRELGIFGIREFVNIKTVWIG